jgi:hypothetical protein
MNLIKELLLRHAENKYIPYDMQAEDWKFLEEYGRNYSYFYFNGNDSNIILGSTQMFRDIV